MTQNGREFSIFGCAGFPKLKQERQVSCHQEERRSRRNKGKGKVGDKTKPAQANEMAAEETISPPSAPGFSTYSHQFCEEALGSLRRLEKLPLERREYDMSEFKKKKTVLVI